MGHVTTALHKDFQLNFIISKIIFANSKSINTLKKTFFLKKKYLSIVIKSFSNAFYYFLKCKYKLKKRFTKKFDITKKNLEIILL